MARQRYVVAKGRSVLHRSSGGVEIHLLPGTFVDDLPKQFLAGAVKSGSVVLYGGDEEAEPRREASEPTPVLGHETELTSPQAPSKPNLATFKPKGKEAPQVEVSMTPGPDKAPPAPPATKAKKLWGLDPVAIKGKTLETLNLMILERDAALKPYDTIEEASAKLSSEFVS